MSLYPLAIHYPTGFIILLSLFIMVVLLIEAFYVGKPTITYLTELKLNHQPTIPNSVGLLAYTLDDVITSISSCPSSNSTSSLPTNTASDLRSRFFQHQSYSARYMSHLWNSSSAQFETVRFSNLRILLLKFVFLFYPIASFFTRCYNRRFSFADPTIRKFSPLQYKSLSQKLDLLCTCLGFPSVRLIMLSPRCFLILKK